MGLKTNPRYQQPRFVCILGIDKQLKNRQKLNQYVYSSQKISTWQKTYNEVDGEPLS